MARRYYSSTFSPTTLTAGVSATDVVLSVAAMSGAPTSLPWTGVLDRGNGSEELVTVTGVSGTSLTVTRGSDGQGAKTHSAGAKFEHVVSARDFDETNAHLNDASLDQHTQYALRAQGLSAARGAAARAGRLHYGTDSTLLGYDDGTAWHEFQTKAAADAAYRPIAETGWRGTQHVDSAAGGSGQSTTSTTYADLATVGPTATVTVPAGGRALVILSARVYDDTVNEYAYMGFAVSGATALAADDQRALTARMGVASQVIGASYAMVVTGLTAGVNTFTAKYRATAGVATFINRRITVVALPD